MRMTSFLCQDVQGPLSTFLRNLGLSLPHEDARTIRFDTQLSALTSNAYRLNLKPDSQSTSWGIEMSSASRRWAAKVLPCSVVPLTYMFLFERLHSNSLMNASPLFMLLCLLPGGERGALYTILDLPTSSSGCIGCCMKLRRTVLLHSIGQPVDPRVRVVAKLLPQTGRASNGVQAQAGYGRRMKTVFMRRLSVTNEAVSVPLTSRDLAWRSLSRGLELSKIWRQ